MGINWIPRKVTNFPNQQISNVAVTNTSTAILTENSEVYVFMNYEYVKVNIQTGPATFSPFVRRNILPTRFNKLISGLYQYSVITSDGDVYLWVPPSKEFGDAWEQHLLPQHEPVRIWNARNSALKALDVAIGIDSTIFNALEEVQTKSLRDFISAEQFT